MLKTYVKPKEGVCSRRKGLAGTVIQVVGEGVEEIALPREHVDH